MVAVAWTVTSRVAKAGKIHIRGTANFTTMATSGDAVESSDFDAQLDTLDFLQVAASGSTEFQYIPRTARSGTISGVDLTSGISFAGVTGPTSLAFWAIGVAKP